ncbi:M43 family zinc metalloprotease [Paraflavitalea sp. CAU 1676]|uniref:M43 family zinc metalloprotease n=1 Tax=Paraflavitalea sp. CAU 1676 TaxID=3032598 RepID=UPI0023D9B38D|nr:M43 family zinc metalloprotease [Paraflavitalea sp. CAU 1676]MDF2191800.1 M43 family zinc metalloprotease [Paraflavitalea sp. CAU 1676]
MKHFVLACLLLYTTCCAYAQRSCASFEYQQQKIQSDPLLAQRLAKALTPRHEDIMLNGADAPPPVIIRIPVVVHILYNKPANNITDVQIRSQIDVLNKDYRKLNSDSVFIPAYFKHLAADCRIGFELAKLDPSGKATTGIVRKSTSAQTFGLDDRIKFTARGGSDAWDADSYLNLWVGDLSGGLQGYASVLGCDKSVDGVAIAASAFGTTGTATAPYNKGRTATHEIGHWLGLRHIWGDALCGDDQVDDTPPQRSPSRSCPKGVVISCGSGPYGDMYNNFMDFTDDACLNLFTTGQRNKMRELFLPGGVRYSLLSSKGLTGTGIIEPDKPVEDPVRIIQNTIRLYPNPAPIFFTVSETSERPLTGKLITLTNRFGQKTLQKRITRSNESISIQHLPDGVYIITIEGDAKSYKLMKGQ